MSWPTIGPAEPVSGQEVDAFKAQDVLNAEVLPLFVIQSFSPVESPQHMYLSHGGRVPVNSLTLRWILQLAFIFVSIERMRTTVHIEGEIHCIYHERNAIGFLRGQRCLIACCIVAMHLCVASSPLAGESSRNLSRIARPVPKTHGMEASALRYREFGCWMLVLANGEQVRQQQYLARISYGPVLVNERFGRLHLKILKWDSSRAVAQEELENASMTLDRH